MLMARLATIAGAAGIALALVAPAAAQTKWNLPAAYPTDNPHTVNLLAFAKDVNDLTVWPASLVTNAQRQQLDRLSYHVWWLVGEAPAAQQIAHEEWQVLAPRAQRRRTNAACPWATRARTVTGGCAPTASGPASTTTATRWPQTATPG